MTYRSKSAWLGRFARLARNSWQIAAAARLRVRYAPGTYNGRMPDFGEIEVAEHGLQGHQSIQACGGIVHWSRGSTTVRFTERRCGPTLARSTLRSILPRGLMRQH